MKTILPLALLCLTVAACHKQEAAPDPVRPALVYKVEADTGMAREVFAGELRARYETDLGFRIGGKMLSRAVSAGDRVKRGQVLAKLDPQDAALAATAARAQISAADSDVKWTKAELDRYSDLLAKGFISKAVYDQKQNAYSAAVARLEQARAQAGINANQVNYTTLVADADGVITQTFAEQGQVLTAGQPVARLARDGERDVVINVSESRIGEFKAGRPTAVALWSDLRQPLTGAVREINAGADLATRTFTVKVGLAGVPAEAPLGMTARVYLASPNASDLVSVPLSAVYHKGDQTGVWVVTQDNKVKLRPVTVKQLRETTALLAGGVQPGETIVATGVHKLIDGQVIKPVVDKFITGDGKVAVAPASAVTRTASR